jgi:hypothetical protein
MKLTHLFFKPFFAMREISGQLEYLDHRLAKPLSRECDSGLSWRMARSS